MPAPLRVALVYPRLQHQMRSFLAPLGLISLATVARRAGFDVRLFDPSLDRDLGRVQDQLRRFAPRVIGLSVSSDLYPTARQLCAFARELGAVSVLGGPHATICADEIFADCPQLDYLVSGEGEQSFVELLRCLAQDRRAIDEELEAKLPLVEQGGFIPHLDHAIPDDVPYENFAYYWERKKELLGIS